MIVVTDEIPKFLRRIRERKANISSPISADSMADVSMEGRVKPSRLQNAASVAQIMIVIVAIFGYFYTVQPIYQKERLAEEVAEAQLKLNAIDDDLLITAQRAVEFEKVAVQAEGRVAEMQIELEQQIAALHEIRKQRDSIENQIQFMEYTYRLPDGSPADSAEEVRQARNLEMRKRYFSDIGYDVFSRMVAGWNDDSRIEPFFNAPDDLSAESPYFPFMEEEIRLWQQHGKNYPKYAAVKIIEDVDHPSIREEISNGSDFVSEKDLEAWKQLAIKHVRDDDMYWRPKSNVVNYRDNVQAEIAKIRGKKNEANALRIFAIKSRVATFDVRSSVSSEIHRLLEFDEFT